MKIDQLRWQKSTGWSKEPSPALKHNANLVLLFGARSCLEQVDLLAQARSFYPNATQVGCSTAGEICGTEVRDNTAVLTAIQFERTPIKAAIVKVADAKDSYLAGKTLAAQLRADDLVHILCLSDGLKINGSDLVNGMLSQLPSGITITGGLAGDGAAFKKTLIYLNEKPAAGNIVAVGFYGKHLKVGYGSMGGWDAYGLIRQITRSDGNVLYELDGRPALALYKKYLGELAKDLPASALLFPLSLRRRKNDDPLVRTILAIDEKKQTMTFAGDVPEGSYAQFMKANFNRLVDGASSAASTSYQAINAAPPDLAILISCVGRKLVLKQRIEEEVEAVRDVFGQQTTLAGFYSYGEISPFTPNAKCELHNQTMTITTLTERV